MAFFGLTHLGEQDFFSANSTTHGLDLALFAEADYARAFDRVAGKGGKLRTDQLRKVLETIYCGPLIGPEDERLLAKHIGEAQEVDKEAFLDAIVLAREESREIMVKRENLASEYSSNQDMRDASRRNERLQHNPNAKYNNPVTVAQDYGWLVGRSKFEELDKRITKRYPKRASEETAFADAMAAAGSF